MRFYVTHPPDPRPSLVVETMAHVDTAAVDRLKTALLGMRCPNGLLFDARQCFILRDTYSSRDEASFEVEGPIATDRLLARIAPGRALDARVSDWLRSMAGSWNETLPRDQEVAAPFLTDIVPAVSGSRVRQAANG